VLVQVERPRELVKIVLCINVRGRGTIDRDIRRSRSTRRLQSLGAFSSCGLPPYGRSYVQPRATTVAQGGEAAHVDVLRLFVCVPAGAGTVATPTQARPQNSSFPTPKTRVSPHPKLEFPRRKTRVWGVRKLSFRLSFSRVLAHRHGSFPPPPRGW
jgi:hypothetical protein